MKLILSTVSSSEEWNGDCDYAFVELKKEDIQVLLKYRDFFNLIHDQTTYDVAPLPNGKKLGSLVKIEFWDSSVRFFSAAQEEPGDQDFPSWDEWDQVPEDWKPTEENIQRTECGCVEIWDDHMRWTARVKHTDVLIETARIHWERLEKMLKEMT